MINIKIVITIIVPLVALIISLLYLVHDKNEELKNKEKQICEIGDLLDQYEKEIARQDDEIERMRKANVKLLTENDILKNQKYVEVALSTSKKPIIDVGSIIEVPKEYGEVEEDVLHEHLTAGLVKELVNSNAITFEKDIDFMRCVNVYRAVVKVVQQ